MFQSGSSFDQWWLTLLERFNVARFLSVSFVGTPNNYVDSTPDSGCHSHPNQRFCSNELPDHGRSQRLLQLHRGQ
ncbi:hypothetical protein EMIT0P2_50358 [Pseudomonas sp. IT-P2]